MTLEIIVAALLASNATGKTLVRTRPGRIVPSLSKCKTLICGRDASAVAHVYFDGAKLVDLKSNAWSMQGTVPQVARSGVNPPGAGPFSGSNYYTLGTGNDVLDFTGAFAAAVVFTQPSNMVISPVLFTNGVANTNGYTAMFQGSTVTALYLGAGGTTASMTAASGVNVMCFGYTGTQRGWKLNLNAFQAANATPVPATSSAAVLGAYNAGGQPVNGTIYEAYFATDAVSDTLCTSIAQAVKAKLGITAW